MKLLKRKKFILIILVVAVFFIKNTSFATNIEDNINSSQIADLSAKYIDTSKITEEYKQYMELSEEEKKQVSIVPYKYYLYQY